MNLFRFTNIMLIGLVAHFVDGTLGMGYGVTSSTFLVTAGFFPVMVSASVHTAEIFTTFSSGCAHLKFGNVRKDIFLPLVFFGVIGGILGAWGLVHLPVRMVRLMVSVVLFTLGMMILWKYIRNEQKTPKEKVNPRKIAPLGLGAGLIDALGGGGWGPICTPVYMINGSEPRKVIGSVNLAEFFVTTTIAVSFFFLVGLKNIPWIVVLSLASAGMIVAPFTAYLAKRIPSRVLGILIGLGIVALNASTFIKVW